MKTVCGKDTLAQGDISWYSLVKTEDSMSYTEVMRSLPILSSAAGRILEETSKGSNDGGWAGFSNLDSPAVDAVVARFLTQYSRSNEIRKILGKELYDDLVSEHERPEKMQQRVEK